MFLKGISRALSSVLSNPLTHLPHNQVISKIVLVTALVKLTTLFSTWQAADMGAAAAAR